LYLHNDTIIILFINIIIIFTIIKV